MNFSNFDLPLVLTLVDEEPPVVQYLEDLTQIVPLGAGGIVVTYQEPTATDNSGVVFVQSNLHSSGSFFASGVTQVTYIFADPSGNTASCIFRVIVNEGMLFKFNNFIHL